MERKTSGRVLGLRKTVFALSLLLAGTVASFAQTGNATYVRNFINSQGQCKTGALTSSNGCVAIVEENGYAASGIPQSLNEHLAAESKAGRTIDDICLTENGSWYCVGDPLRGVNCPQAMINTVNNFCRLGDRILCVTFDDNGNWIVISSGHWSASNTSIEGNMKKPQNMHGNILTAHLGIRLLHVKQRMPDGKKLKDSLLKSKHFHAENQQVEKEQSFQCAFWGFFG